MVTYWININLVGSRSVGIDPVTDMDQETRDLTKSDQKLVEWTARILTSLLKKVVASRICVPRGDSLDEENRTIFVTETNPIDELTDHVQVQNIGQNRCDPRDIILGDMVETQIHDFVSTIAVMYNVNAFHNFHHANHVVVSTLTLLRKLKSSSDSTKTNAREEVNHTVNTKRDDRDFLLFDPMIEFALVFAAMIHDVDHQGISNRMLIQESTPIAKKYENKSVAEQNSIDIAWTLLMESDYEDLRKCLCPTPQEYQRFRQVVVNAVIATDMFDNGLKRKRLRHFDQVFHPEKSSSVQTSQNVAVLIEHILQASDVIHTMQHWDVYQKWNQCSLEETYVAYQSGHGTTNPTDTWYDDELSFFDHYVIPLAKRIKSCEMFDDHFSDELLVYATKNRRQWEKNGQKIIQQFRDKMVK
jgi:3'5'-cyclic nucleotide phosphodiesterase